MTHEYWQKKRDYWIQKYSVTWPWEARVLIDSIMGEWDKLEPKEECTVDNHAAGKYLNEMFQKTIKESGLHDASKEDKKTDDPLHYYDAKKKELEWQHKESEKDHEFNRCAKFLEEIASLNVSIQSINKKISAISERLLGHNISNNDMFGKIDARIDVLEKDNAYLKEVVTVFASKLNMVLISGTK